MYIPEYFKITDEDEIYSFIDANAFGQLISQVDGRMFSTSVPFLLSDDRKTLITHIAKQNSQHLEIEGQEALVALLGAHEYISPSWYRSAGVPTWNYQAVHVYGKCTVFTEPDKLQTLVNTLTKKYEAGSENPWEPNFNKTMLTAIVGIEISISEIQCKYKLNQNRSADVLPVAEQLKKLDTVKSSPQKMASEMLRMKK